MIEWLHGQLDQATPNLIASLISLPIAFAWHHRRIGRHMERSEQRIKAHVDERVGTGETDHDCDHS